ncbi:MAG: hypothetical protein CME70_14840 [Halobacteriovorax sp.]|nr:hypothetical protein [Halobacteriovorax sp.]|tara:strand:- start:164429 stop:165193 length:765 start_codon:yes stop_codon:yes gene_type:complete
MFKNAASQLASIIKAYLESNPKLSLNRLSEQAGVSEASLRRVLTNEYKGNPSIHLTLAVLRQITGQKSFINLCKNHEGPLGEYLYNELALDQLSENQENYRNQIQSKVYDPILFHVAALAGSPIGVSEEQVEKYLGVEGIKALLSLYEEDFLNLKEGRFHTNEKGVSFARDIFKPVLRSTIELIDTDLSPMDSDNFFYLWTSSLNKKGVQKLRKLKLDTYQKLKDLTRQERYQGEKHVFFFGAFDTYKKNGLKK